MVTLGFTRLCPFFFSVAMMHYSEDSFLLLQPFIRNYKVETSVWTDVGLQRLLIT